MLIQLTIFQTTVYRYIYRPFAKNNLSANMFNTLKFHQKSIQHWALIQRFYFCVALTFLIRFVINISHSRFFKFHIRQRNFINNLQHMLTDQQNAPKDILSTILYQPMLQKIPKQLKCSCIKSLTPFSPERSIQNCQSKLL